MNVQKIIRRYKKRVNILYDELDIQSTMIEKLEKENVNYRKTIEAIKNYLKRQLESITDENDYRFIFFYVALKRIEDLERGNSKW